jgi:hypothetical protein
MLRQSPIRARARVRARARLKRINRARARTRARARKKMRKPNFPLKAVYTLYSKRMKFLELPKLSSRRPQHLLIDASGVKILGEGEWKVKVHGKGKRLQQLKEQVTLPYINASSFKQLFFNPALRKQSSLVKVSPLT